ncbi:MAG: hypothetical protein IPM77_13105 [Crocinitomicaceae bacterium]|nr:hypothetical protein [Crocinitomicaceae bacterium]
MIVNQRLYAKEKLIVDLEAKFKQDVKILGTARISTDLVVDGTSKLNGNVKMDNIGVPSQIDSSIQILVIQPNGQIKKIDGNFLNKTQAPNLECIGDVLNPIWYSGPNKIYSLCPIVKVGIGTSSPNYSLTVEGIAYSHRVLVGSSFAPSTAIITGYSPSSSGQLIDLGVTGGTGLESRFNIHGNGSVVAQNVGAATTFTLRNGLGSVAEFFANNGVRLFHFGKDGKFEIFTNTGIKLFHFGSDGEFEISTNTGLKLFELNPDGSLTWRNNGGVGFIAKNTAGTEILKLGDNGILYSKEIIVTIPPFPDYVFQEGYDLKPIEEVEEFVKVNKHLPGIPKADELAVAGMNVGEMQVKQMEKIEDIYLYLFEMNKRLEELENENEELKGEIELLKNQNK